MFVAQAIKGGFLDFALNRLSVYLWTISSFYFGLWENGSDFWCVFGNLRNTRLLLIC